MAPLFEYFVVCGIGPEINTLYDGAGYYGFKYEYEASLMDQYPPLGHNLYPELPPELPKCVLPAGIEFFASGFDANDFSSYPRSYPIVLTVGDGSKLYVSCITFRDPVDKDIAEAYGMPSSTYAEKCISLVSRMPCFRVLRDAVEEIFSICFSPAGCRKPLWEVIEGTVSNVPLPTPGKDRVLFSIDSCLLYAEAPAKSGLSQGDISFQPLVQCLDVHNVITLFTAVLLERRVLLRSNKYSLLTLIAEAICQLIYPFEWQHVYVPILFSKGVDFVDAPTPYIIGLHSSVDTSELLMDGVVVVDIDHNFISTSEEIPGIPDPELSTLHSDIMNLLYPNLMRIDEISAGFGQVFDTTPKVAAKLWGEGHDLELRFIFLKFFATVLCGYREFLGNIEECPFDAEALILQRARSSNLPPDAMITQFLGSQGFSNYIGRILTSSDSSHFVLDNLIDAIKRGQNPMSIIIGPLSDPIVITIPDPTDGISGSEGRYTYDMFPAYVRTEEQLDQRQQILLYISQKKDEASQLILDIKVKLQRLWISLMQLEAADAILQSDEYETILALIETDSQGLVGSAFVEGIQEHMNSGWNCRLSDKLFVAVKELVKGVVNRAIQRNDMRTLRDALAVSAEIHRKDVNGVSDYIQRHLLSLSIWENTRFWVSFFDYLMEQSSTKSPSGDSIVLSHLMLLALHMGGLGVPDTAAWPMIENIALINNIDYEQYVHFRGYLSYTHRLHMMYWGMSDLKVQSLSFNSLEGPHSQDAMYDGQQLSNTSVARNWVKNMFGRDTTFKVNSFSRAQGFATEIETSAIIEIGTPRKQSLTNVGPKKLQTNVRILRGHKSAITALHCVSRKEVWDLVADRDDSGFFISGSTDCSVKIWDPSRRGAELLTSLKGHTGAVRAISSDRWKVVSGSDDLSIVVWDKEKFIPREELKGHKEKISCVRMLSGERILSSAHDGSVKMWDARTGSCIATVAHCPGAILCLEYDDYNSILAAAGRDSVVHIWDIRAGKQVNKLMGHSKWIRSMRMVGDIVVTGSDDWTARIWSIYSGACEAVLARHAGPVLCVEKAGEDNGIITGSDDGLLRFWETTAGNTVCVKDVAVHSSILSINASDQWLAVGSADSSMLLFNQPQERSASLSDIGTKSSRWQLYRTPQAPAAVVRCVASDLEHKRICSGGRDGLIRLWDATISI